MAEGRGRVPQVSNHVVDLSLEAGDQFPFRRWGQLDVQTPHHASSSCLRHIHLLDAEAFTVAQPSVFEDSN